MDIHRFKKWRISENTVKTFLFKAFVYFLLLELTFVFLLPFITILSRSTKSLQEILNPITQWLPSRVEFTNYSRAFEALNYGRTALNSVLLSVLGTGFQLISCALAGYAIARYKFWGRNLMFVLVILTIIVPPQTIGISRYMMYHGLQWINTYYPMLVPELLGHGLRGGLFVLIYSQFFKNLPPSLEESARIDGANAPTIFIRVVLPLAKNSMILVSLFSFVWHWNDTYSSTMFLSNPEVMPAIVRFETLFDPRYASINGVNSAVFSNDGIKMAAALLIVLPLVILYICVQRQFSQSIERSGLVE